MSHFTCRASATEIEKKTFYKQFLGFWGFKVFFVFKGFRLVGWLCKVWRPIRHVLGHFGDCGVTAASARIIKGFKF